MNLVPGAIAQTLHAVYYNGLDMVELCAGDEILADERVSGVVPAALWLEKVAGALADHIELEVVEAP